MSAASQSAIAQPLPPADAQERFANPNEPNFDRAMNAMGYYMTRDGAFLVKTFPQLAADQQAALGSQVQTAVAAADDAGVKVYGRKVTSGPIVGAQNAAASLADGQQVEGIDETNNFYRTRWTVVGGALTAPRIIDVGKLASQLFSLIGDSPDYQTAIGSASLAKQWLYISSGQVQLASPPDNPYGVKRFGPGRVMRPVKPSDLSKGYYQDKLPELDADRLSFGHEYLNRAREKWRQRNPVVRPKILILGNSTHAGAYITDPACLPHNMLRLNLVRLGFNVGKTYQPNYAGDPVAFGNAALAAMQADPSIDIVNLAVSGSVAGLMKQILTDAVIQAFDWFIIGGGINDPIDSDGRAGTLINDERTAIQQIRGIAPSAGSSTPSANGGNYFKKTISVKIDNSVSNTYFSRDETQQSVQTPGLLSVARQYQCHAFNTQKLLSDTRGAAGIYNDAANPPTVIVPGWMDSFARNEPSYYDPSHFDDDQVHPLNQGNVWIWGKFADDAVGEGLKLYANNRVTFDSSRIASPGDLITSFDFGITVCRAPGAASGGQWPADGFVKVIRNPDNTGEQINWDYFGGAANPGITMPTEFRRSTIGGGGAAGWTNFAYIGVAFSAPTFANSWVDAVSQGGCRVVHESFSGRLQGAVSGGSLAAGTTILTLPAGFNPYNAQAIYVCAAGNDGMGSANLSLNSSGVLSIIKPPPTAIIWLDNINWLLRSSLGV